MVTRGREDAMQKGKSLWYQHHTEEVMRGETARESAGSVLTWLAWTGEEVFSGCCIGDTGDGACID